MRRGEPALLSPRSLAAALALSGLLGAGCSQEASTPSGGGDASGEATAKVEEGGGLEARARQYLELKQRHAWAEIYDEVLDPESRNKLEKQRFLRKREKAFDILGFEVVSAEQNGPEGRVRVQMEAMIPVLKPGGETTLIRKQVQDPQEWVFRDGRWYIRLEG